MRVSIFLYLLTIPSVSFAEFDCSNQQIDVFETGLGFHMWIPLGFSQTDVDGYPKLVLKAAEIDALGIALEYNETTIWTEKVDRNELDTLDELDVRHSLGTGYEFRGSEYEATPDNKRYFLAVVVDDIALMVLSRRPIPVDDLLTCFVPQ